ncbi:M14 family zinc carboxypeptidase [Isoptericola variabilis]|uniref:Peptidase M14 carboxypeptidase A n=1 Tax=Isoptericola variabilis (strain 225) TaxID=743718 RepID=F6FVJ6_ISOV2|nr:M14 family zinc carboxypeptidase [Isoptericola variabilis]AEG44423.1 peptidase M14 carboxypeptidase A [Isoptericola variabilis 225]TWH34416.1 putative deacylase [Isoptericola variabilis J7]
MSRRRVISSIAATTLVAGLGLAAIPTTAQAQNGNAECSNLSDPATAGWVSHAQLGRELRQIEATSAGRVEVDVFGHSREGRELYAARVGTGDKVLMIQSEIHGNEKVGTLALLKLLKTLATSGSPEARAIREGVTLVALPMLNPDGSELNQRQNEFTWEEIVETYPQLEGTQPPYYYSSRAGGLDLNRDFSADLDAEPSPSTLPADETEPGMFLSNESRALRDLYKDLRDEFGTVHGFVDLHHMGPCNQENETGQYVTVSLDYPPLGSEADGNPRYADWPLLDQDASRRLALAAALGMQEHAGKGNAETSPFFGGVVRYIHPQVADGYDWDRDYAGQARSAFALNGTSTVLFEIRGQSHAWGQKQMGMLTAVVEAGITGIASRMADGSVDELDGDAFFDLPKYW